MIPLYFPPVLNWFFCSAMPLCVYDPFMPLFDSIFLVLYALVVTSNLVIVWNVIHKYIKLNDTFSNFEP